MAVHGAAGLAAGGAQLAAGLDFVDASFDYPAEEDRFLADQPSYS